MREAFRMLLEVAACPGLSSPKLAIPSPAAPMSRVFSESGKVRCEMSSGRKETPRRDGGLLTDFAQALESRAGRSPADVLLSAHRSAEEPFSLTCRSFGDTCVLDHSQLF